MFIISHDNMQTYILDKFQKGFSKKKKQRMFYNIMHKVLPRCIISLMKQFRHLPL